MDEKVQKPGNNRLMKAAAGAAITAGVAVGAGALAFAATDPGSSTTAPPATTAPGAQAPAQPAPGTAPAPGPGRKGPGFGRHFGGPGIHGQFTVPKQGGGYETIDTQEGAVTAVSNTSITVKSDDGFEKTYVVNGDTVVNAGRDGIADVKTGNTVHLTAVEASGAANAVEIADETTVQQHRGAWAPAHP